MPKFQCAYAYDVPHYVDFIVEAKSEKEAEKIIQQAVDHGRFANVCGDPEYDLIDNERAFVMEKIKLDEVIYNPTMEQLIAHSDKTA